MTKLHSIQTADKIFTTSGSKPILITCSDMNAYVCKYYTGYPEGSANKLLTEYLGARFLQIWGLGVPDFSFVSINFSHIPGEWQLPSRYFDRQCFGSKFNRNFDDLHYFSEEIKPQHRAKYKYIDELIMITLFDIWLSNDDRNHNNYNLMVDINHGRRFIPIDHETLFNGTTYNHNIYEISFNESLIDTDLFSNAFSKKYFSKERLEGIENAFYLCVGNCKKQLPTILSEIPESWNIDLNLTRNKMESQVFSGEWIRRVRLCFLEFLELRFK